MERKRTYYLNSLQGRINLSMVLIVLISVLTFMIVSIRQTAKTVENTSVDYTLQLIQMVNENIEDYIENMNNIAQLVSKSSDVRSFLFHQGPPDSADESSGLKVAETFRTLRESRTDIYNIGIIAANGRYLINDMSTNINKNANLETQAWFAKAIEQDMVISNSHVQNLVEGDYHWVVTLSQKIPNLVQIGEDGIFFIDLNYNAISGLCEEINLGSKGYVYIIDDQGALIYHPKQQLIYSGLWEEDLDRIMSTDSKALYSPDRTRLFTISRSEITGWTVVGVTYLDEMLSGTGRIRMLYVLMAAVLIGVALLLAILLTDMVTKPLRLLRKSMKIVEKGDFDLHIEDPGSGGEISDLFNSYRIMIMKIRQLLQNSIQAQEEKRMLELNTLQAQINPHFLYNTLDSIIWMAEDGATRDVVLMTSSLAKLLRKSISNNSEMVTVAQELDYTESYLVIQKMRYKDKLEYEIDLDESIRYAEIVKLIVQPLVENAIYHGIKYKEDGKGFLKIVGRYEEDEIRIRIIDNGIGMTPEQLSHIFDEKITDTRKNGVGVLNVHRRIQLHYGEDYGLSFESTQGVGTVATIRLPDTTLLQEKEEGKENSHES